MKTYDSKEVTVTEETVLEIRCNKCGKIIDQNNYAELNKIHTIMLSFGYGSEHDMETWDFDVCEDCILEYIKGFKIAPNITGYLVD